jgi:hypothetical protein
VIVLGAVTVKAGVSGGEWAIGAALTVLVVAATVVYLRVTNRI